MMRALLGGMLLLVLLGPAHASTYDDFSTGLEASNQGNNDLAIASFSRALEAGDLATNLQPVAYLDRGKAYFRKGDFDKARSDFESAIHLKPDYSDAYYFIGISATTDAEVDQSLTDFNTVIKINPNSAMAYDARGIVYALKGDFNSAIQDQTHAIQLRPNYAGLYADRAKTYARVEYYEQALADLDRAIGMAPALPDIYLNRALVYEAMGRISDAQSDYDTMLRSASSFANYFSLGRFQWSIGKFADAAASFERAFASEGSVQARDYVALWLYLARARLSAGAAQSIDTVSLDLASWPAPILNLYQSKTTPDDVFKAIALGGQETTQDERCEADFYVGEWHLLKQDTKAARPLLEEAARICPSDFVEFWRARLEVKRLQ